MQVGTANDALNDIAKRLDLGLRTVLSEVLYDHMLDVMDRAKELCPKESGALAASGRVNKIRVNANGIFADLDFGVDPFIDYALDQHENLLYAHKDGEQAKFLEAALLEWISGGGPEEVIEDAEDYLGRTLV
jgi:hypothetical protein